MAWHFQGGTAFRCINANYRELGWDIMLHNLGPALAKKYTLIA